MGIAEGAICITLTCASLGKVMHGEDVLSNNYINPVYNIYIYAHSTDNVT